MVVESSGTKKPVATETGEGALGTTTATGAGRENIAKAETDQTKDSFALARAFFSSATGCAARLCSHHDAYKQVVKNLDDKTNRIIFNRKSGFKGQGALDKGVISTITSYPHTLAELRACLLSGRQGVSLDGSPVAWGRNVYSFGSKAASASDRPGIALEVAKAWQSMLQLRWVHRDVARLSSSDVETFLLSKVGIPVAIPPAFGHCFCPRRTTRYFRSTPEYEEKL